MIKTFKFELVPNNKQHSLPVQSAGTASWAYNWALAKEKAYCAGLENSYLVLSKKAIDTT
jgi:hypothetical protein